MHPTLFFIHDHLFGLPLFGNFGLLFWIWVAVTVFVLGRLVYRQGMSVDVLSTMALLALIGAAICLLLPRMLVKLPDGETVGLPIRSYGVMVLLGMVAGVCLAVRRGKQRGIEPELIFTLAVWLLLGGLVGARLFYVAEYWHQQFSKVDKVGAFEIGATLSAVLRVWEGGLVIYGALIGGGVAGLLFWLRHRELPMLKLGDVAAPSMVLGLAIGRIGCFLNGCCFGGVPETPLRWAVTFPEQSPPYMRQVEEGRIFLHGMSFRGTSTRPVVLIDEVAPDSAAAKAGLQKDDQIIEIQAQLAGEKTPRTLFTATEAAADQAADSPHDTTLGAAERALLAVKGEGTQITVVTLDKTFTWTITSADEPPARSLPVHPTQLYSALDAALLCLLLLAFDPFRTRDGQVLALMLTVHPISRFLLESIRTDEPKTWPLPFTSHLASISQLVSVLILIGAIGLWCYICLRMPRLDGSDLPSEEGETEGDDVDVPPETV